METSVVQPQTRPSWGDDDDDDVAMVEPEVEAAAAADTTDTSDSGSSHGGPRFRVSYAKHSTTYAKVLYDVHGHLLVDEHNAPVNVFTRAMKDMMDKGEILCYHAPGRPGHRYFCTHKKQADEFRGAKKRGFSSFDGPYHVYEDEPGTILPFEGRAPTTF